MQLHGHRGAQSGLANSSRCSNSSPRIPPAGLQRARRLARAPVQALNAESLVVGYTTPQQYFPVADLHTACFHEPCTSPNDRLWHVFDRIWGLQVNASLARRGAGRCVLLVAFDPDKAPADAVQAATAAAAVAAAAAAAAAESKRQDSLGASSNGNGAGSSSNSSNGSSNSSTGSSSIDSSSSVYASEMQLPPDFGFPKYGYWLSRLVDRTVWPGLGLTHDDLGIVGVAQVDTFGDIIPPRTLSPARDGAFGWVQREGYAYISNVAVSPSAQRRGVASRLMSEAEALAASWGCSKAGLHVNMTNTPALQLYRSLKYKKGALEAPWMPYLQGRAPDRCMLMLKRLSHSKTEQQQQQQQQQQQLLGELACSQQEQVQSEAAHAALL